MLYQVATRLLSAMRSPGRCARSSIVKEILKCFWMKVMELMEENRIVHLKQANLPSDFLILATRIQYCTPCPPCKRDRGGLTQNPLVASSTCTQ